MVNFTPKLVKKDQQESIKSYEPITKYMAKDLITFKRDTEINKVVKRQQKVD